VWNAIPPACPQNLLAYLVKVTRNTALDILERRSAAKRGGGQAEIVFSDIEGTIAQDCGPGCEKDSVELTQTLNSFLEEIPGRQRVIFLRRYFYFNTIGEIALDLSVSESMVKSVLFRLRKKLKVKLEKEDLYHGFF
jgi:RNA polymerase sigma-70 factor (ECF subfamily)